MVAPRGNKLQMPVSSARRSGPSSGNRLACRLHAAALSVRSGKRSTSVAGSGAWRSKSACGHCGGEAVAGGGEPGVELGSAEIGVNDGSVVLMPARDSIVHFLGRLLEQGARFGSISLGHFPVRHLVEPAYADHLVGAADIGPALDKLAPRFKEQRRPLLRAPTPGLAQRIVTSDRLPRDLDAMVLSQAFRDRAHRVVAGEPHHDVGLQVFGEFPRALAHGPPAHPAADTKDRKSTRLNSSHTDISRMPSSVCKKKDKLFTKTSELGVSHSSMVARARVHA